MKRWTRVLVLVFLASAPAIGAGVQPPAPSDLATATARLQAKDWSGAAQILEEVITREPGNGRAWRMLGTARLRMKAFEKAVAAYRTALDVQPDMPMPFYNIGVVYAQAGDKDRAFEWLGKARATRKIDMTQIQQDDDLAGLKADARFAALLPLPDDFANPFVEPVRIIREWDGESANDQFGWIARNVGDVDRDGVADVVTSAPSRNAGGAKAGRVYVYSTRTGKLLWAVDGHPGDQLGTGVEGAGDTNHDGVPDVIASAPGAGRAYVYSGVDGRVLLTLAGEGKDEDFGRHAAGVGDFNGDGYADVIVGAPGKAGAQAAGRAYVYSGKDGQILRRLDGERAGDAFGSAVAGYTAKSGSLIVVGAPAAGPKKTGRVYVYDSVSTTPKFVIESDDTGNALGGMFVSVLGNIDGAPAVYASDWSNAAKGPSSGRVYVHSSRDGRRLLTLTGETAGEGFGTSPSNAGDVDGDGNADLIVGAWQYSGAAMSGGRAYLYSGRDGRLLRTFTCRIPGDTFGFDAVTMGDVDGDGKSDFLITSAWSGIHGYHSGRMFIVSSTFKN